MIKAAAAKRRKDVVLPTAGTLSKGDKLQALRKRLETALRSKGYLPKVTKQDPYPGGYIEDMYDNTVVFYAKFDELYACSYSESGDSITLGEKVAVVRKTIYVKKV